jgi:sugar phosphate isomerase/epimerase
LTQGPASLRPLGIELLTVLGLPPVPFIALAESLGCPTISTGLNQLPMNPLGYPDYSLREDRSLRREVIAALRDTGVAIGLGEGFRVRPDADLRDCSADLDIMAELGAQRINAVSTDADAARTLDQLGRLAEMTAARGMAMTIEFAPPNAIACLDDAIAVITAIGQPHVGLTVDAMHFFRSGGTVEQLAALPGAMIGYAQLCDAPPPAIEVDYMQEAMFGRLLPGDGVLPLAAFIAALPSRVPLSLEVPNLAELKAYGAEGAARRAVDAARKLLAQG